MKTIFAPLLFAIAFAQAHADAGADLATKAQALLDANPEARAIEGRDGWLFLANELRHVAKGTDWVAPEVPPEPAHADPIPALTELKAQLDELGIELVLVPVPAKAVVYPEQLPGDATEGEEPSGATAFLDHMREQGFTVVDLEALYKTHKTETLVYCKTDTHWSPQGVELAADAVGKLLREQDWYAEAETVAISLEDPVDLRIRGDLTDGDYSESLPWRKVTRDEGGALLDDASPVLVLGDSHTLVFGDGGDMHAQSGGFIEHLAHALQMPVDRMANRGSASTPPRLTLFRKASGNEDWLTNKKVVVYTFTARELTESLNGWRIVPIAPRFR
ncbi:MAG: hypothetical protein JJU29_16745 [Verrucomicrobia bacterium]|nr:hypothetical protein [Verrucomicrobiota bacterium]MCH8513569.1 hypothetical protein [Kiritimatiellia bacterium]